MGMTSEKFFIAAINGLEKGIGGTPKDQQSYYLLMGLRQLAKDTEMANTRLLGQERLLQTIANALRGR